uniref:DUF4105 domain-containing protein n=2 Tax=Macrostomum lignano TaxID=282301 RepID=A0A1I8G7L4_9PLAT
MKITCIAFLIILLLFIPTLITGNSDSNKKLHLCQKVEATAATKPSANNDAHVLLAHIQHSDSNADKQLATVSTAVSHAIQMSGQSIECRYRLLSAGEADPLAPQLTAQLPVAYLLLLGQTDWQPLLFAETELTGDKLLARLTEQPAVVQDLDDGNFEGLTQAATGSTTGHWLVAFLDPKDAQLSSKTRILTGLAQSLRPLHVSAARVLLTEASHATAARFGIAKPNSLLLFRSGAFYKLPHQLHSWRLVLAFARHGYSDAKKFPVPAAPTPFDHAVDAVVAFLLSFNGVGVSPVYIAICAGLFVLMACIIAVCLCAGKGLSKVTKTD